MKAYWCSKDGVAIYGNNSTFVVGETYEVPPLTVVPCRSGFHASVNPLYALLYTRFAKTMDVVVLGGLIMLDDGGRKHVASERTHVKRISTTPILLGLVRWLEEKFEVERVANRHKQMWDWKVVPTGPMTLHWQKNKPGHNDLVALCTHYTWWLGIPHLGQKRPNWTIPIQECSDFVTGLVEAAFEAE